MDTIKNGKKEHKMEKEIGSNFEELMGNIRKTLEEESVSISISKYSLKTKEEAEETMERFGIVDYTVQECLSDTMGEWLHYNGRVKGDVSIDVSCAVWLELDKHIVI